MWKCFCVTNKSYCFVVWVIRKKKVGHFQFFVLCGPIEYSVEYNLPSRASSIFDWGLQGSHWIKGLWPIVGFYCQAWIKFGLGLVLRGKVIQYLWKLGLGGASLPCFKVLFLFFSPKMTDCIYNEPKFTMGRRKEGMSLSGTKGFFASLAYRANSWVTFLQNPGMEV